MSARYSDDDLELVAAETDEELQTKVEAALREKKIRFNELGPNIIWVNSRRVRVEKPCLNF